MIKSYYVISQVEEPVTANNIIYTRVRKYYYHTQSVLTIHDLSSVSSSYMIDTAVVIPP